MLCGVNEVLICAQKNEVMPDAKLRNQSVDRSDLHTRSATHVSHTRRCHMVFAIRLKQSQRRKPLHDLFACLGSSKALKKFLQDKTSRHDNVGARKRIFQRLHLGCFNFNVTSEGQRPDARINQERHFRERSAL